MEAKEGKVCLIDCRYFSLSGVLLNIIYRGSVQLCFVAGPSLVIPIDKVEEEHITFTGESDERGDEISPMVIAAYGWKKTGGGESVEGWYERMGRKMVISKRSNGSLYAHISFTAPDGTMSVVSKKLLQVSDLV